MSCIGEYVEQLLYDQFAISHQMWFCFSPQLQLHKNRGIYRTFGYNERPLDQTKTFQRSWDERYCDVPLHSISERLSGRHRIWRELGCFLRSISEVALLASSPARSPPTGTAAQP